MSVKLVVAVTDSRWYQHLYRLNSERKLEDVNFWQPPAKTGKPLGFRSLRRGELFLFHVKGARDKRKIAGGGVFLSYLELPCSYAWKIFGQTNGADSIESMKRSIASKTTGAHYKEDFNIGCRVLAEPIFLPQELWFTPPGWKSGTQSYKGYDTDTEQGKSLWEMYANACNQALSGHERRFGKPQLIQPRLGQGAFRTDIVRIYESCAVTRERTLVVLEAAHIRPYSRRGSHEISNGLLLRSDLHALFDRGYVTVVAEQNMHRFLVSRKIREDFGNGRRYYEMNGSKLLLPREQQYHPSSTHLGWHNEYVYLG